MMWLQMPKSFVLHNKMLEKMKEENIASVKASSIGKIIPLLSPLLILSSADYRSIVRLMNVS